MQMISNFQDISGTPQPKIAVPPRYLGGARVVCFVRLDQRHRYTGHCMHNRNGIMQGRAQCLAICQYDGETGFYLFSCDANWSFGSDTFHETLAEAKSQAEFEYNGTSKTWEEAA